MTVLDAQGFHKTIPAIVRGMIIAYSGVLSGNQTPLGWAICDGTLGTPDLTDRFLIGDTAVGTGTAGGTASPITGLTHSGFALAAHAAHVLTQASGHSNHTATQPDTHSAHTATQPATHSTHSSEGAHTHDSHALSADGSPALVGAKRSGPNPHSSDGAHTHDAHPAHTGFAVDGHSAHSGWGVDAHDAGAAHSGATIDAHSAHSVTQPDTHTIKHVQLAYLMKL